MILVVYFVHYTTLNKGLVMEQFYTVLLVFSLKQSIVAVSDCALVKFPGQITSLEIVLSIFCNTVFECRAEVVVMLSGGPS